jgi:hypothetical protein
MLAALANVHSPYLGLDEVGEAILPTVENTSQIDRQHHHEVVVINLVRPGAAHAARADSGVGIDYIDRSKCAECSLHQSLHLCALAYVTPHEQRVSRTSRLRIRNRTLGADMLYGKVCNDNRGTRCCRL